MPARFVGALTLDANAVLDQNISTSTVIDADKMQHVYRAVCNFDATHAATPASRTQIIHVAGAAGTIRGFHCVCLDTGTSASVTFDLKKNGTTVLSGVVTITNATTDAQVQDGTISVPTFAADDYFTVVLTVSSSTGMTGAFCYADFEENAAP